jgi:hypothetical protein
MGQAARVYGIHRCCVCNQLMENAPCNGTI